MIKSSKRIISLLIVLALALACLPMAVFAATTIYVQPNANWLNDGARFAAYFYDGAGGEAWVDATDADGDGLYAVEVPDGYANVIFCRMNPNAAANNWTNKWNQTGDLTVPTDDKIVYVVPEGSWDKGAGQWIAMGGEVVPVDVTYHIVGSMNGWTAAETNAMTAAGELTYTYTVALEAGSYEYKVTTNTGLWSDGDNLTLTVDSACDVTFTLTLAAEESLSGITVTATGDGIGGGEVVEPTTTYYVAGDEGLTGYAWDAAGAVMTDNGDGTWSATFTAVAAGDYQFKVTDGTWNNSWGKDGGNVEITVEAEGDVTITFNPTDGSISYTGAIETPAEPLSWGYINVVGNGSGNWLFGEEWNVDSWNNGMTPDDDINTTTALWTATYTGVAAGEYEFKLAADSAYDICWATGNPMVSGVAYEAYFAPLGNSSFTVAEDNSTVTIALDMANMDPVTGAGATLTVTIEAGVTASAPAEFVVGDNNYTVVDADALTAPYTALADGTLTINPTALDTVEAEDPSLMMAFGRGLYAIVVDGVVYSGYPVSIDVVEGQTYQIGLVNNCGVAADVTLTAEFALPVYDVKWQITAGTTAESESTNMRLVSYVDSLDYESVAFNVTVNGETVAYEVTTVYSSINADGAAITDPSSVFEGAAYFVAIVIEGIPADSFGSEIEVSVTWTDLEGNATTSDARSIVISDTL